MSSRALRRHATLAAVVLTPLALLGASGCETVTDVPLRCRVLGPETVFVRTVDSPEIANEGWSATLELETRLPTGLPGAGDARVVGYDISLPLPAEIDQVYDARVATGGNILGRALIENRRVFIRFAGGTATVADTQLPKVTISAGIKSGIGPTNMSWKAPDRIDVLVEWNGLLGTDTCYPADPAHEINTTHIQKWTPNTYPPGSYPGTVPGTGPRGTGPVVTAPPVPVPTVVVGPATSIVRDPGELPPTTTTTTTTHPH
jgi:hypothetical protein